MKFLFLILSLGALLFSSEYVVVVNHNSKIMALSKKQLKDIFLMKRHFTNSVKVVPINLSASSKVRKVFERKVLKVNREKLNRYWIKQHFHGISPPIIQSSNMSMKLFVKNVDMAIGYLPSSFVDSDLRVIYEF
jgi:ABC-type phosphate transport system substrate-binding protein